MMISVLDMWVWCLTDSISGFHPEGTGSIPATHSNESHTAIILSNNIVYTKGVKVLDCKDRCGRDFQVRLSKKALENYSFIRRKRIKRLHIYNAIWRHDCTLRSAVSLLYTFHLFSR